ncbi:hypothetical protein M0R45_020211 [Rubus argutus]|uniref:Uncharacterized protein n=1 Tax=Rubus argutus TaxID=59490 RepID=A0AAW1XA23_RUBAR
MADEAQYSSGPEQGAIRRKYEEQPAPTTRRVTGFLSHHHRVLVARLCTYVLQQRFQRPVEDIQLAKQRVQEISAQLFNNASSGAAACLPGLDTKRPRVENGGGFDSSDKGFSSIPTGREQKIDVPNGRGGRDHGTPDQIAKAEHLINEVLAEAESGGLTIVSRRSTGQAGSETICDENS